MNANIVHRRWAEALLRRAAAGSQPHRFITDTLGYLAANPSRPLPAWRRVALERLDRSLGAPSSAPRAPRKAVLQLALLEGIAKGGST